jgi:hypothetical protein
MDKFWAALKFAINIYIVATFITLMILGVVNIVKKITEKKS